MNTTVESMICPVCKSNSPYGEPFERYEKYRMFECAGCGLVFSSPMKNPGAEWYEKQYQDNDFLRYHASRTIPINSNHAEFFRHFPNGERRRLLDVGCSVGRFIYEARERDFDVYGTDFSAAAIELGRQVFGFQSTVCLPVEKIREVWREPFAFVTFFEVLEHLENPVGFLESIKELMVVGGTIVFSVPNRKRHPKLYEQGRETGVDAPPHHLTKWERKSVSKLLAITGFETLGIYDVGNLVPFSLPTQAIGKTLRHRALAMEESNGTIVYNEKLGLASVIERLAGPKRKAERLLRAGLEKRAQKLGYERELLVVVGRLANKV